MLGRFADGGSPLCGKRFCGHPNETTPAAQRHFEAFAVQPLKTPVVKRLTRTAVSPGLRAGGGLKHPSPQTADRGGTNVSPGLRAGGGLKLGEVGVYRPG